MLMIAPLRFFDRCLKTRFCVYPLSSFATVPEMPKPAKRKSPAKASPASKKTKVEQGTTASDAGVVHLVSDNFTFDNTYTPQKGQVKLISWNVNGLRAVLKKESLLDDYVKSENPDVLCLQETKLDSSKLDEFKGLLPGYHQYWSCADKPGYSGTALFSKEKPVNVTYGLGIAKHDTEGRVIIAEYPGFFLLNCYVPNAGQTLDRLDYRVDEWDVDLKKKMKDLEKKKPVVLTGDLNVAHEDIDIHSPKTNQKSAGFTPQERESFSKLLADGFVDTFRQQHPDTPQYSYWGYRFNCRDKNKGWRLDYFVVSDKFKDTVKESFVRGSVGGSDHCPIGVIIDS